MSKFFMPIELHDPKLPTARRWFFLEIEAVDEYSALLKGNRIAQEMIPHYRGVNYSRWACHRELPSNEYMQALSDGLRKSRGKSPRARQRAVNAELAQVAA